MGAAAGGPMATPVLGSKRTRHHTLEGLTTEWEDLTKQRNVLQCQARRLGKGIKKLESVLAVEMRKRGLTEIEVNGGQSLLLESHVRLG
jgi:hypothetical protein